MRSTRLFPMGWGIIAVGLWACTSPAASASVAYANLLDTICTSFERTYPLSDKETTCWNTLTAQLRNQVTTVQDNAAFTHLLNQGFSRLGISHLHLYDLTESQYDDIQSRGNGHSGLSLQWIENQWYVASVMEHSDAYVCGIRPGYHITRMGPWKLISDSTRFSMEVILHSRQANFGPPGDAFQVEGFDSGGSPFSVTCHYGHWAGKWSKPFGNLQPLPIALEVKDTRGVRVIRFSHFVFDLLPSIREAIESTPDHAGIVFDLRGNPGGMGILANAIAGKLTDTSFELGTMHMIDGWIAFVADPQPKAFLGPVAILIDEFTASTSEIFAQGMKEHGRARVFGKPSMGAALPSKFIPLGSSFMLQMPVATYQSAAGYTIEGKGVQPHEVLSVSVEDVAKLNDPVLSRAIDWILETPPTREVCSQLPTGSTIAKLDLITRQDPVLSKKDSGKNNRLKSTTRSY